jgi:dienelactone hydrolase
LVLAVVCAAAIVWPALFGTRSRRGLVFLATIGVAISQLVLEGFRWQLIPVYLVALGLGLGDLFSVERDLPWWRRVSRPVLGLVGLGMMVLPSVILPVPILPEPGGPLEVGTVTLEVVFPERPEAYGENPDTRSRRVMVQVWYPAEAVAEPTVVPWTNDLDVVGPALARRIGFPSFALSHTSYTSAHGVPSAPALAGTYPVVLYSHGWRGFRSIAINQMEMLASHGYVVIAPDHTYGALTTRFPDGDIVGFDPDALPDEEITDPDVYADRAVQLVDTFTDDLIGLVDALELGEAGPFGSIATHADLGRIGVYGHSTGGGAAVRFCLSDERCDAVLGMDAWVEPVPDRIIANEATVPMLFMRSDGWRGTPNDGRLRGLAERSTDVTYWIGIEGAGHNDFVVTPFFSPVAARLGMKGPISVGRVVPIIDRFLRGFFDSALLGAGTAAVEQNPFREVTLEVLGRAGR